ncbi:MAG: hypothetical protein ACPGSB_00900 [Opitutales bacterium]
MKTTIDLPDPLFREAKATAAAKGQTLKTFITDSVRQSLNNEGGDWRAVLKDLPRVDKETLETIRLRVEASDRDDLTLQEQAERQGA